jgi:hypothetical protein
MLQITAAKIIAVGVRCSLRRCLVRPRSRLLSTSLVVRPKIVNVVLGKAAFVDREVRRRLIQTP